MFINHHWTWYHNDHTQLNFISKLISHIKNSTVFNYTNVTWIYDVRENLKYRSMYTIHIMAQVTWGNENSCPPSLSKVLCRWQVRKLSKAAEASWQMLVEFLRRVGPQSGAKEKPAWKEGIYFTGRHIAPVVVTMRLQSLSTPKE